MRKMNIAGAVLHIALFQQQNTGKDFLSVMFKWHTAHAQLKH